MGLRVTFFKKKRVAIAEEGVINIEEMASVLSL